jgi:hypothetical protein
VHAEDLLHHQDHGQVGLAGGRRAIGGHLEAAHVVADLAHGEAVGRRADRRLRHQRHGGRRVADTQRRLQRSAAGGAIEGGFARPQRIEIFPEIIAKHGDSPVGVERRRSLVRPCTIRVFFTE